MRRFVKLHENDNVAVAVIDLAAGTELEGITVKEPIERGHKVALTLIEANEDVRKDDFVIGHATAAIEPGAHVHKHNVSTNFDGLSAKFEPQAQEKFDLLMDREIRVYHRKNWEIGIRNELWIVPTVGHVNKMAQRIKDQFLKEVPKLEVDGIHVFEHPHGCFQVGEDLESTRKILQNIVLHPNTGGVLVVGLGTESNSIEAFKATLGDYDEKRIFFMDAQEHTDEVKTGVKLLNDIHNVMKNDYRSTSLLRNLKVGVKYGDFDGVTAITASPLLSYLSDYLVRSGGTVALTEVQQMVEANKELLRRIESEDVFQKVVGLANDFKIPSHYISHKQGITTVEEKSLGYLKKLGKSSIVDAISYGGRLNKSGLNVLESPSNDLIAATALGAAGCHMVLHTTSHGTPFGAFVPTVKIATNSELAKKKPNWVDYNAEEFLMTTKEEAIQNFINYICDVASGKWVKNEYEGYREIAIWKRGITL